MIEIKNVSLTFKGGALDKKKISQRWTMFR